MSFLEITCVCFYCYVLFKKQSKQTNKQKTVLKKEIWVLSWEPELVLHGSVSSRRKSVTDLCGHIEVTAMCREKWDKQRAVMFSKQSVRLAGFVLIKSRLTCPIPVIKYATNECQCAALKRSHTSWTGHKQHTHSEGKTRGWENPFQNKCKYFIFVSLFKHLTEV